MGDSLAAGPDGALAGGSAGDHPAPPRPKKSSISALLYSEEDQMEEDGTSFVIFTDNRTIFASSHELLRDPPAKWVTGFNL
jgi:hypothetical protein